MSEDGAHFLHNAMKSAVEAYDDIITINIAILIGDDCKRYYNGDQEGRLMLRLLGSMDESDVIGLVYILNLIKSGHIKTVEYCGANYFELKTNTQIEVHDMKESAIWRSYIVNKFISLGIFLPVLGGLTFMAGGVEVYERFMKTDLSENMFDLFLDAQNALHVLRSEASP